MVKDLIEKLEAAPEGSRELDEIIAVVMDTVKIIQSGAHKLMDFPYYTFSIDAALTLVPEGWGLLMDLRKTCRVRLEDGNSKPWIYAITPALALCIAALKAREEK